MLLFLQVLLYLAVANAVPVMKLRSWLPMPNSNDVFQPFLGTADRAAWDPHENYLYVIGFKAETLHIIDMINHSNPHVVHSQSFHEIQDGIPRAIAFCRNNQIEELAIAFSAKDRLQEGHVEVFRPWHRFDHNLPLRARLAVESDPSAIKFDKTCTHFVVACEGLPGSRNNLFEDPIAHIDIFSPVVDGWTKNTLNFINARGLDNARYVFKDLGNPSHSVVHDIEPSDLVIDDNDNVFISLHENNAIAKFNLHNTGAGIDIYDLGTKDWNNHDIDTSDRDSSIHPDRVNMVRHNIRSFHQPKRIDILHFKNQSYILTANTGGIKSYTAAVEGVDFNEANRARLVDDTLFDPSLDAKTKADLNDDAQLGRLYVSTLQQASDGWDNTFKFFKHAYAYGARSWGIWHSDGITELYDSGDGLEYHASQLSRNVFNGDCFNSGMSPPQHLDTRSDDMGSEPSAIATGMIHGHGQMVVVASGRMGGMWLYSVGEGESPDVPTAQFQSYVRLGDINGNWGQLYSRGDAGVQYISDILLVDHHDHQMIVAVGSQMGAVAFLEIEDE